MFSTIISLLVILAIVIIIDSVSSRFAKSVKR